MELGGRAADKRMSPRTAFVFAPPLVSAPEAWTEGVNGKCWGTRDSSGAEAPALPLSVRHLWSLRQVRGNKVQRIIGWGALQNPSIPRTAPLEEVRVTAGGCQNTSPGFILSKTQGNLLHTRARFFTAFRMTPSGSLSRHPPLSREVLLPFANHRYVV